MTAENRAAHVEREAVAGVLAEHYWADTRGDSGDRDGKWWQCGCGHEENIAGMSGWSSWKAAHNLHVADAVLAALPQTGDAAAVLCSQCGERLSAMVKIGTNDGWCTVCLDEAAETSDAAAVLSEQEKALRDRLSPEDWMIVKAGFRRSYMLAMARVEALPDRIEVGERDLIALTDLSTGRVEFEKFGSTPFANVPRSPYYASRPGFWLSTRTWLDEDGVHVVHAHDCRETREVHLLPYPTWQVVAGGQVLPSFSCDGCGLHYFPTVDAALTAGADQ